MAIDANRKGVCVLRRHIADDCLFTSLAYLGATEEEVAACQPLKITELREYCANAVAGNENYFSADLPNSAVLEQSSEDYGRWILDRHNWGGENEIRILAVRFNIEVALVACESLSVTIYNQVEGVRGRWVGSQRIN